MEWRTCLGTRGLMQYRMRSAKAWDKQLLNKVSVVLPNSLTRFLIFMYCLYKCVAAKLMFAMANSFEIVDE